MNMLDKIKKYIEYRKARREYNDLKLKYEQGLLLHKHHLAEIEKKDNIIDEIAKSIGNNNDL